MRISTVLFDLDGTLLPLNQDEFVITKAFIRKAEEYAVFPLKSVEQATYRQSQPKPT